MAILPICITGEPVLHSVASEVERFDDELKTLVADMVETMHAAPGVGLAAPQIGLGLRLFVYSWEDEDGVLREGTAVNPKLWITPTATRSPHEDADSEGCLSIPGERAPLVRASEAILEAFDETGEPFRVEAKGWFARILQHEYDHLNGVLYADRLAQVHQKKINKVIKQEHWGTPGITWTPGVDDLEG